MNEKYREFRNKLLGRSPKALKQMAIDAGFPELTDTTDKEVLLEELFAHSEGGTPSTAPPSEAQKVGASAAPGASNTSTSRGQDVTGEPTTPTGPTRSIRAIKAHFRCGHRWTPVRQTVSVKEFNEAQWAELRADKGLQIQDG